MCVCACGCLRRWGLNSDGGRDHTHAADMRRSSYAATFFKGFIIFFLSGLRVCLAPTAASHKAIACKL